MRGPDVSGRCGTHARVTEWLLASLMLAWGLAVALPGDTLGPAGYRLLAALAPETAWAGASIGIGLMRMTALWINGRWRRSPLLRAGGAAWGIGWWLVLGWLSWLGSDPAAVPVTIAYYPVLAGFEAHAVYRGAGDAHRAGAWARWQLRVS